MKMSEDDFWEERMFKRFGILTIIYLLLFSASAQASVLLDRIVAVVNQEIITWSELYKAMEADAGPELKQLKDDERNRIYRENEGLFLEKLIDAKLQLQEAANLGIGVSEQELREAVDNIKKKYSMTEYDFIESLKKEGFTFSEYRKRLREQIILSKIVNTQINNKIMITDQELNNFISENKQLLEDSETYRIRLILLRKSKETESSRIEEKAAELLRKLENGESFGEIAKQYSEGPSAEAGGDLGSLKKSHLNKQFTDVIAGLQPGETSKPFWAEGALHIIKLESRTTAKNRDEMLGEARGLLQNKVFSDKYKAWIKSLREKAFIEVRL
jgi:peptidyl-prolyl cis-trans isomerase SurA